MKGQDHDSDRERMNKLHRTTERRRRIKSGSIALPMVGMYLPELLEPRRLLAAEMVADLWPGPDGGMEQTPGYLVDVAETLFFFGSNQDGFALWKTSGAGNGVSKVKRLPFPPYWQDRGMAAVGGKVFFVLNYDQESELWSSDGTATGTSKLLGGWGSKSDLTGTSNLLYFVASDGDHGQELWKSDGTAGGTRMVRDIASAPGADSWPHDFTTAGNVVFFTAEDGTHGEQMWMSNGTAGGTVMIADTAPVNISLPELLADGDHSLFLHDGKFWVTDGTARGTLRITAGTPNTPTFFSGRTWVNLNGRIVYASGTALWKSDGTSAGTVLLRHFPTDGPFGEEGGPERLVVMNGSAYFSADDGAHGIELWKTDGTAAGTVMVGDLTPGAGSTFAPWSPPMASCDGRLYLTGLRESDGTAAGTIPVWNNSGWTAGEEWFGLATVSGNALYFAAADSLGHGTELWKISRDLPPAFAALDRGTLTVDGSAGPDIVEIHPMTYAIDVTLNGRLLSVPGWEVLRVSVNSDAGDDVISCDTLSIPVTVNAGIGNDCVIGGNSTDVLRGEGGKDTIVGGRGDDTLDGQSGHDYLIGGEGNDLLSGGSGDDRMEGNAGRDTLYGRAGNDALFGGSGNDRLDGGGGNDNLSGQAGADRMLGGDGRDRFFARDSIRDILDGGGGRDLAQVDPLLDQLTALEQLLT